MLVRRRREAFFTAPQSLVELGHAETSCMHGPAPDHVLVLANHSRRTHGWKTCATHACASPFIFGGLRYENGKAAPHMRAGGAPTVARQRVDDYQPIPAPPAARQVSCRRKACMHASGSAFAPGLIST